MTQITWAILACSTGHSLFFFSLSRDNLRPICPTQRNGSGRPEAEFMKRYRIAVVGKHNHLNWDVYVARAFRRLGHEVILHRINDFPFWFNWLRPLVQLVAGRRRMRDFSRRWLAARWHQQMLKYQPELVFFTSACFIPETYFQLARQLTAEPCVMGWEADSDYAIEERIDYFDHFFEGGRLVQMKFPQFAPKISSLYLGVDEEVYQNRGIARDNSVYFCGAWSKIRDPFCVAITDVPLLVKGWNWNLMTSKPANLKIVKGTISAEQLAVDYNSHTLALNISQFAPESQMLFNMRTFEAPACGACLVTQRIPLTEEIFKIGEEILVYDTPDELAAVVKWAIAHPAEVEKIAQAGEARVKRDHTYVARMRQVLNQFEKIHHPS